MLTYITASKIYGEFIENSELQTLMARFLFKVMHDDSVDLRFFPSPLSDFLDRIFSEIKIRTLANPQVNPVQIIKRFLEKKKHKKEVILFLRYFYDNLLEKVFFKKKQTSQSIFRVGNFKVAFGFFRDPWFRFDARNEDKIKFRINRKNKHVLIELPGACTERIDGSRWHYHTKIDCAIETRKIAEKIDALVAVYSVYKNGYNRTFGGYTSRYMTALVIYLIENPPHVIFSKFKKLHSPDEIKNMSDEEFLKKFQPGNSCEKEILNILLGNPKLK